MQKRNTHFPARRLAINAMLIAIYVLLGFAKIPIGNLLRINLASFSVVVCAVLFSPVDGLIVGFLGEFISQVIGPFGMTPTTLLWVAPEAVRGLLLGCAMVAFTKKQLTPSALLKSRAIAWYLVACVVTGVIASLLNTFALYVDSKMFGYYNYYMVFGILLVRLGLAVVMSGAFGFVALHIAAVLRRNKIA